MYWIQLAHDIIQWQAFLNTVATDVQLARRCVRQVQSENGVVAGWWDIGFFLRRVKL
jgi:hypothetical protein